MEDEKLDFVRRIIRIYTNPFLAIIFIIFGTFAIFAADIFKKVSPFPYSKPEIIGLAFISFGVMIILFNYLQGQYMGRYPVEFGELPSSSRYYRLSIEMEKLREIVMQRESAIQQTIKGLQDVLQKESVHRVELSPDEKGKLVADISKSIDSTLSDSFIKVIDEKYSEAAIRVSDRRLLLDDFKSLKSRLIYEVETLRRRSSSNLAIGSITTLLAMAPLSYIVLSTHEAFANTTAILSYYIPRLSFILFIEVFAFFFLRLYKANLSDIKFYQNELTTIELKILALNSALSEEKSEALIDILKELSKTERNFILKKGETTVELERERIQSQRSFEAEKLLSGLLPMVRGRSRKSP